MGHSNLNFPLNIVISNHMPVSGSGSATYTLAIAKMLKEKGHNIIMLCIGRVNIDEIYDGIRFITRSPELSSDQRNVFPTFTGHPESDLLYNDLSEEQLKAYRDFLDREVSLIIDLHKADLFHAQHVFEIALSASALKTVPVVATCHGSELNIGEKWIPPMTTVSNQVQKIVSISEFVGKRLISHISSADYEVILNGFDDNVFYPNHEANKNGRRQLLSAGRHVPYKRLDIAIETFSRLIEDEKFDNIDLIVAGDGPLRNVLETQATDKLPPSRFKFTGFISPDEMAKEMNKSVAILVPSLNEPFGLIALEALGCGTPVIASNSGGLVEFVNNDVGALVDEDLGIDGWVSATKKILLDNYKQTHSADIVQYASELTWEAMTSKLEKIYSAAISSAKNTP